MHTTVRTLVVAPGRCHQGPREFLIWDEALLHHFNSDQVFLRNPQTLTIPRRFDHLILTVDASSMNKGLGATLFVKHSGKCNIAQFSFKMNEHQLNWYPCDLEALEISTGAENFTTYISESI